MRGSLILIGLLLLGLARSVSAQEQSADEMVAAALKNPMDEQTVFHAIAALRQNPSPSVISSSRELFSKISSKNVRQLLALALIQAHQGDDIYFDELAKYARIAISSTAPLINEYDAEGNWKNDHINPALPPWCEANHLQLDSCKLTVALYGYDVFLLGEARDARASLLLRQALSTPDPDIVQSAVRGLAWLKDAASIPSVAGNIQRFPAKIAEPIAAELAEFDDPRIGPLLDRFVTNSEWRKELDDKIRKRNRP